jgi:hypothetical protein
MRRAPCRAAGDGARRQPGSQVAQLERLARAQAAQAHDAAVGERRLGDLALVAVEAPASRERAGRRRDGGWGIAVARGLAPKNADRPERRAPGTLAHDLDLRASWHVPESPLVGVGAALPSAAVCYRRYPASR